MLYFILCFIFYFIFSIGFFTIVFKWLKHERLPYVRVLESFILTRMDCYDCYDLHGQYIIIKNIGIRLLNLSMIK